MALTVIVLDKEDEIETVAVGDKDKDGVELIEIDVDAVFVGELVDVPLLDGVFVAEKDLVDEEDAVPCGWQMPNEQVSVAILQQVHIFVIVQQHCSTPSTHVVKTSTHCTAPTMGTKMRQMHRHAAKVPPDITIGRRFCCRYVD